MTTDTGQLNLSHWLIRLIAFIIDMIIVGIPAYIIYFFALFAALLSGSISFIVLGTWLVFPLFYGILLVIYSVILEVYWGATIGKRLFGLQVQLINGGKVTIDKAFIRNISKIYAYEFLLLLDWLIAVLTPGADKSQKFTDRIAGTTVVQVRQAFQSTAPPPPPPPPS